MEATTLHFEANRFVDAATKLPSGPGVMKLLTWHGTILCRRTEDGVLVHLPLLEPPVGALEIDLPAAAERIDPGDLIVGPGLDGRGVSLRRGRVYVCAEPDQMELAIDRDAVNPWECFLPLPQASVAQLRHLMANRWIVGDTRRALDRNDIRLEEGFILRIGAKRIDLCRGLDLESGDNRQFHLPADDHEGAGPSLILAEPHGSLLLQSAEPATQARRLAEMMVLAGYRVLRRREPTQQEFDRDAAFLIERGAPTGLADLLERLRPPGMYGDVVLTPEMAERSLADAISWPVISLGTMCVVAVCIHDLLEDAPPMPFDWLRQRADTVRHCLEDDFATLLDRSHHVSLTGVGAPGEPETGGAHLIYLRQFGIDRTFNHFDPTQPAAYRYLQSCVDRFRAALAEDGRKLFVQLHFAYEAKPGDFLANLTLLDRVTNGAALLQIALCAPDPKRQRPIIRMDVRTGAHVSIFMHPTSALPGERFASEIDTAFLRRVIQSHALQPTYATRPPRIDHVRLLEATEQFHGLAPEGNWLEAAELIAQGQAHLREFLHTVGVRERFRYGNANLDEWDPEMDNDAIIVQCAAGRTELLLHPNREEPWVAMTRATALICIIDEMLHRYPQSVSRFVAELDDYSSRGDSASFCSDRDEAMLLPDPDFIASGGYLDERELVVGMAMPWHARRPVAFWRGVTTGQWRHAPPAASLADDFTWLPRLDLVWRARNSSHASFYDVGVAAISQIRQADLVRRIEQAGLMAPVADRTEFFGCRAIIVIDGNSNAWSALFCALLSGACVLKVESEKGYRQWYHDRLVAWVHYVPVRADLADMDECVTWVMTHDEEAACIGGMGQDLAHSMTFEQEIGDAAERLHAWLDDASAD